MKRTSVVWEFFELMDERKKVKKAVCKLCDGLRLVYAGGTTKFLAILKHSIQLITRRLFLQKLLLKEASYSYLIPGQELPSWMGKCYH